MSPAAPVYESIDGFDAVQANCTPQQ